ncbi:hypothetical protein Tsubulata_026480 [Turnera subulata]|uniref:ABC transporter domain-containing protein n=1 Tax=Turnera subulata TaxID=218843 RepID=A0A9Q0F245_9ROSI|nr:hypothetical protein Tsubulata_026480 [Turnera subulata]
MFRFIASLFQTLVASLTAGSLSLTFVLLFGGFIIPKPSSPVWLKWGFWISPLSYGEIGLTTNEFLAPRWEKIVSGNTTIGQQALEKHGLNFPSYYYWIAVFALIGCTVLLNIGFALALTFLKCKFIFTSQVALSSTHRWRIVLPFEPLTITFQDVQYYVDTPSVELCSAICSLLSQAFVNEVLETIELDEVRDSLVGIAGTSGLSTEQRKRLTVAVELVANPSIIFMDEPTSGLDARAAAIVMRAVKNIAETGRTVVCTIHQPSIDIFEAFDELVLLKIGGRIIYSGPIGQHSSRVIQYFESIPAVPKIKENYNPATWMLEVTSKSAEAAHGQDFAKIYEGSILYQ